jgi:hypothetical protein
VISREEHGEQRRGRLTGSHAARLLSGNYKTWNTLLDEIRSPPPFYDVGPNTPPALAWGKDHEAQACAKFWESHPHFELHNPVFMRYHDAGNALRARWLGVSPDRMVSHITTDEVFAGLEAKCPFDQKKFFDWLASPYRVPEEHVPQCLFGALVTGKRWWYFTAFDPREDEHFYCALDIESLGYRALFRDLNEKTDRFLEVLDAGERFKPIDGTAKQFEEMFK